MGEYYLSYLGNRVVFMDYTVDEKSMDVGSGYSWVGLLVLFEFFEF